MRAELLRLSNLLDNQPEQSPPPGLTNQILNKLAPPPIASNFSLSGLFASFQPATAGLAFAACLVGAILGDIVMYAIGYHFGHNLLKDHPKLARFVRADREAKFEEMIERLDRQGLDGRWKKRYQGAVVI